MAISGSQAARKKYTNRGGTQTKGKKQHTPDYYPVQREIPLGVFDSAISATTVGDAGRLLSIANRRLMRYGMNYQIKIDLDPVNTIATAYQVEVFALTNNWDVQRAFALAKATYDEAHADELKASGKGQAARWRDFRVAHNITGAVDLDPVRYDQSTLAAIVTNDGEHVDSTVDDNGAEKVLSWSLASASAINILAEWQSAGRAATDQAQTSPNAPYGGVNADTMSDIEMVNLGEDGNVPPYSNTSHADLFTKVATLRYQPQPDGMQRLSTGYFDAPCGLFVLKTTAAGNLPNGIISMTAKAGDYKGVSAQRMCQ